MVQDSWKETATAVLKQFHDGEVFAYPFDGDKDEETNAIYVFIPIEGEHTLQIEIEVIHKVREVLPEGLIAFSGVMGGFMSPPMVEVVVGVGIDNMIV